MQLKGLVANLALGLSLSACLKNPLPVAPTRSEPQQLEVQKESPIRDEGGSERQNYLNELSDEVFKTAGRPTSADELVALLQEMNAAPEDYALSTKEIRSLQKIVFQNAAQLGDLTPPGAEERPELPEPYLLDVPTECPEPEYKIIALENGLRLIQNLPRPKAACSLALSQQYQDALNAILKRGSVRFVLGGREQRSGNLADFFNRIGASGHRIEISYRVYLAPFVRLYRAEGDPYAAETEIPLPLWLKTGLERRNGRPAVIPAPHSEVFFRIVPPNSEVDAQFKIYFSDKGFVFDDENLFQPHWIGSRILHVIPPEKWPQLLPLLQELHETFELFRSRAPQELPLGGFGLLGVCNDGAALAMKSLFGPDFVAPFPLVRTDLISMPDEDYPQRKLWESTPSDTWENVPVDRDMLVRRVLVSNPFVDRPNPFPAYQKLIEELASP